MYGGIGMSASSLRRESTDSLIYTLVIMSVCNYKSDINRNKAFT